MRFCFYSGYRDLKGGYTTLLLTLIRELYHQKQEVVLLNFSEGLFADELRKQNIDIHIIDLDTLNWGRVDQLIFPDDIFIITKFVEPYRHLLKVNPRVIYYDINDFICKISDYKYGIRFPSLGKRLVQSLLGNSSLVFMDDTGVFNLRQYFSMEVPQPVFLPIPVTVPPVNAYLARRAVKDDIRFTYIGRSVDWKMMPLKKILKDCAASDEKIKFSIVVDSIADLRKFIVLADYQSEKLQIDISENMPPSLINEFLLKTADLHFAMGTAALDAAKLGVPTIVVDYATTDFPQDYRYKWLFETTGYSLGRNLDKIPTSGGSSMAALLDICRNMEKLQYFSEKSYEYVRNDHAVDNIVSKLGKIAESATFRMNDAKHLVPFYFKAHTLIKNTAAFFNKTGRSE